MADVCLKCNFEIRIKSKDVKYFVCNSENCSRKVHVDCTTIAYQFFDKHKLKYVCDQCKSEEAALTSKAEDTNDTEEYASLNSSLDSTHTEKNDSCGGEKCTDVRLRLIQEEVRRRELENELEILKKAIVHNSDAFDIKNTLIYLVDKIDKIEKKMNTITTENESPKQVTETRPTQVETTNPINREMESDAKRKASEKELTETSQDSLKLSRGRKTRKNFAWNPIHMCKGNVLNLTEEISIAHCVGKDMLMSDGIAAEIKQKFSLMPQIEELKEEQNPVGSIAAIKHNSRYILNLITKEKSREKPTWKNMKETVKKLPDKCKELGITNLCMPKIGSGLDALCWRRTMKLLKNVFKDEKIKVTILNLKPTEEQQYKGRLKNKRFKANPEENNKLVMLGDSHLRGLRKPMEARAPADLELEIYPDGGANTSQILNDLNLLTSKLPEDDYLVVMSGTNDMTFTNQGHCIGLSLHEEARKNLFSQANHTNVLILSTPNRFDKPDANEHIKRYNAELERKVNQAKEELKFPSRLQYKDVNDQLDSSHYTTHGLHLNWTGKEEIATMIANCLNMFPVGEQGPSIDRPTWEEDF